MVIKLHDNFPLILKYNNQNIIINDNLAKNKITFQKFDRVDKISIKSNKFCNKSGNSFIKKCSNKSTKTLVNTILCIRFFRFYFFHKNTMKEVPKSTPWKRRAEK